MRLSTFGRVHVREADDPTKLETQTLDLHKEADVALYISPKGQVKTTPLECQCGVQRASFLQSWKWTRAFSSFILGNLCPG